MFSIYLEENTIKFLDNPLYFCDPDKNWLPTQYPQL